MPRNYRSILRALDPMGERVVLVHADDPRLQRMAVLDVILNNADRKGGHVLEGRDGDVYGVDHGICLHSEGIRGETGDNANKNTNYGKV